MQTPELRSLGDRAITTAVTNQVITSAPDLQGTTRDYLDRMDGILAASFYAGFNAGNGAGSSCKVDILTSLNQGLTWIPVLRFSFANVSGEKLANLSGLTPKAPLVPESLTDNAALDGILGPWWRAAITTVGTFGGGATIAVRMQPR